MAWLVASWVRQACDPSDQFSVIVVSILSALWCIRIKGCGSFLMGGTGYGEICILLWWVGQCSVQSLSPVGLFATPWTAARQASLSFTIFYSLLKLMSIESVMLSKHLILCCPLFLLPSIFPSIRVFSNESVLRIRWPKYKSFSFKISPSNEYSGLFFFRIDWFYLLAIQGTVKSLLQYHSSKASILWCSFSLIILINQII